MEWGYLHRGNWQDVRGWGYLFYFRDSTTKPLPAQDWKCVEGCSPKNLQELVILSREDWVPENTVRLCSRTLKEPGISPKEITFSEENLQDNMYVWFYFCKTCIYSYIIIWEYNAYTMCEKIYSVNGHCYNDGIGEAEKQRSVYVCVHTHIYIYIHSMYIYIQKHRQI